MMDFLDSEGDFEGVAEELEDNSEKISELHEKQERLYTEREEYVTEALYSVQESLDEGESFTLMSSEEVTGAGHYKYEEALTSEGVVAENVRRVSRRERAKEADSSELYGWPSDKEPLDLEKEYLSIRGGADSGEFLEKLVRRITSVARGGDELPQDYRAY